MNAREQILTSVLNCRRSDLYFNSRPFSVQERQQFESMIARLDAGEPLQYILGNCEFFGLKLAVDERVLIPRPETEILVERAIEQLQGIKDPKILDIGTGSGNIAIALAKNVAGAQVTTIDYSQAAQTLARENARQHQVEEKINFINADILEACHAYESRHPDRLDYRFRGNDNSGQFDLIISNPPYIPSNQLATLPCDVQKEPKIALDGGVDGLKFYRVIIQKAALWLKADGALIMEIGDGQRDAIEALLDSNGSFKDIRFHKDYVGTDRIAVSHKL